MRVFLDANILVSVLNKEYPVFTYSSRILSLADNRQFALFTSPICLAIAFYFAEKKSGTASTKNKIELLASKLSVTEVGKSEVMSSLKNVKVNDFEDGLEYYAALNSKCTAIITEDMSDFYFSEIEVFDSKNFLGKYLI